MSLRENGTKQQPNIRRYWNRIRELRAFTIAWDESSWRSRRPTTQAPTKEFEEELKVDPENAAAEFMLGESARQAGHWEDAIARFSKASKLDEGFSEAYLALGMSLNSAGKFPEAVSPLETYVKLQPGDPAGHYQLATAYARTGRQQEAEREMKLQQEATAKSPQRGARFSAVIAAEV